jgi:plasmid replication initiation protein
MNPKEITTSKVNLVQPNRVTNARYDYTAVQENILTCMIEAIQGHMSQERTISTDLFGHPIITVNASEIAKGNTKHYVFNQLKELRKKDIEFQYQDDKGKQVEVHTGLINSFKSVMGSDLIDIEISVWAIPYLLYWGKGVGGTIFSKTLALTLKSIYSKRMYKLCKRWENKGGFTMDISEFKSVLGIDTKYAKLIGLKKKVLDVAKEELDEAGDVSFEYALNKIKSRSFNQITFKIFSKDKGIKGANTSDLYRFVYYFICRTYPSYTNDKAKTITDKLAEKDSDLRKAFQKFTKLDDAFSIGSKSNEDLIKLTKHILKEDFEI